MVINNRPDLEIPDLEIVAFEAWIKRGRPIGSPDVDWEQAQRQLAHQEDDQETSPTAPGSTPTDLGADLLPENSHDQKNAQSNTQSNSKHRRTE